MSSLQIHEGLTMRAATVSGVWCFSPKKVLPPNLGDKNTSALWQLIPGDTQWTRTTLKSDSYSRIHAVFVSSQIPTNHLDSEILQWDAVKRKLSGNFFRFEFDFCSLLRYSSSTDDKGTRFLENVFRISEFTRFSCALHKKEPLLNTERNQDTFTESR